MAMDAKQRKTLMIRIGAGVFMVLALVFILWLFLAPSGEQGPPASQLGPSDNMLPQDPKTEQTAPAEVKKGVLSSNQSQIQFQNDKPDTVVFTLQALGGPIVIQSALIPTTDADVLKVSNIDCPVAPQTLGANMSCTASVTWTGARTVNSTLTITTGEGQTTGANVVGPPTAAPGADPAAPGAQPAAAANVITIPITATSTKPAEQQVPAPAEGGQASAPQPASGMSAMQMAREAYLAGRRAGGTNVATFGGSLQAAARSPYTSWDNLGVRSTKSSSPTDMSRVITPDKPMTAVLTYQIDTRQTVTAVATVDRDVYGSSGRTVVMPRGSKIIGRVGGGATDRVGIAWNQIIRPDGVRFVFQGESGDAMGRGGVPGRINNRYLQRYGFSLLPTLASAGLTAALGGQSSTAAGTTGTVQTMDARAVAAQILQQPLNTIANDIYSRNQSMPVQITIPAGTRITVWSVGDLRLKPAGEDEDPPRDQNANGAAQQGQQGFNGFGGQQGQQNGQQQNPYAQQQATQQGGGQVSSQQSGSDNGSALQVGRVDSNGNYIAPGANGPMPGPVTTNTNNAAARQMQQQQTRGTTMPANPNPWQ